MTTFQPAKYNRITLVISFMGLALMFLGVSGFLLIAFYTLLSKDEVIALAVGILALTAFVCWARAPQTYDVTTTDIEIVRNIGTTRIPLSSIREIRLVSRLDIRGWNKQGAHDQHTLLSYNGLFPLHHHTGGVMSATGVDHAVSLNRRYNRPFVITVREPEGFASAVRSAKKLLGNQ